MAIENHLMKEGQGMKKAVVLAAMAVFVGFGLLGAESSRADGAIEHVGLADAVVGGNANNFGTSGFGVRVVDVHHRRKIHRFVNNLVATLGKIKTRQDERLTDGNVLMHHDGTRSGSDDTGDFVANGQRHFPPAFSPGAYAARGPGFGVIVQSVVGRLRHRAQRVVDQVQGVFQNRKLRAVRKKFVHRLALFSRPFGQVEKFKKSIQIAVIADDV